MQNHRGPSPSQTAGPGTVDPRGYLGGFRLRALAAGVTLLWLCMNLQVCCWCADFAVYDGSGVQPVS